MKSGEGRRALRIYKVEAGTGAPSGATVWTAQRASGPLSRSLVKCFTSSLANYCETCWRAIGAVLGALWWRERG